MKYAPKQRFGGIGFQLVTSPASFAASHDRVLSSVRLLGLHSSEGGWYVPEVTTSFCVHAGRTVGRDRHRGGADFVVAPRGTERSRGSPACAMRQQSETDGTGDGQLRPHLGPASLGLV